MDIHVGSRIRLRRNMLGMSQEKLGENLGITFQQIQKYEKGTNRVGASRLQAIASILSVPVAFFFEDAPGEETGSGNRGFAEDSSMAFAIEFCGSPEGLQPPHHRSGEGALRRRRRLIFTYAAGGALPPVA
ncbi:helix-turn-helix transcriptional regulator [Mesorhizobium sp.]|uniref:helix-turn-helix domain-containing protein n=1 Tax=Mesorhizobium sp. TaxID=1871066 RepID=UPI00344C4143